MATGAADVTDSASVDDADAIDAGDGAACVGASRGGGGIGSGGGASLANAIMTAGCEEGAVVVNIEVIIFITILLAVFIDGGNVSTAARGVQSHVYSSASARFVAAFAVVAVIAGYGMSCFCYY